MKPTLSLSLQFADKRHRELLPLVTLLREQESLEADLRGARELLADPDMRELAEGEVSVIEARLGDLAAELEVLLLPTDPDDTKNVIVELRSGAGGAASSSCGIELGTPGGMTSWRSASHVPRTSPVARSITSPVGLMRCSVVS